MCVLVTHKRLRAGDDADVDGAVLGGARLARATGHSAERHGEDRASRADTMKIDGREQTSIASR